MIAKPYIKLIDVTTDIHGVNFLLSFLVYFFASAFAFCASGSVKTDVSGFFEMDDWCRNDANDVIIHDNANAASNMLF